MSEKFPILLPIDKAQAEATIMKDKIKSGEVDNYDKADEIIEDLKTKVRETPEMVKAKVEINQLEKNINNQYFREDQRDAMRKFEKPVKERQLEDLLYDGLEKENKIHIKNLPIEIQKFYSERDQSEANLIKQKVEAGEAENYEVAEELLKSESEKNTTEHEKREKEFFEWAKEVIKIWHDVNPDYIFVTETSGIPFGFVFKEAWKNAYSKEKTPSFHRFEPESIISEHQDKIFNFFDSIIKKNNPTVICFDEGSGCGKKDREVMYEKKEGEFIPIYGVSIGTLVSQIELYFKQKKEKAKIFLTKGGRTIISDTSTTVAKIGNDYWSGDVSRSPSNKVFGALQEIRGRGKHHDEQLITQEYLDGLIEKGRYKPIGTTPRNIYQRKRAVKWVKELKDLGKKIGEELRKEIEEKNLKNKT